MFRFLQNYPHLLEKLYDLTHDLIRPFRRWLRPDGRLQPVMVWVETVGKGAVFDCQMCGQCVLHSTGMTCPMTCPKNLRNGPCGGVRSNGHCEVKPDMRCVWTMAFARSLQMPDYGRDLLTIQPPLNRQLEGASSWISMLYEIDSQHPSGWVQPAVHPRPTQEMDELWTTLSNQAAA